MASANADYFRMPESRLIRNINEIFQKKKYRALKKPYNEPEKCNYRPRARTQRIITYCVLLNELLLDNEIWERLRRLENSVHCSRVRYVLAGNILKAIFTIHERNKQVFMNAFEKSYVKIFTFPTTGEKVCVSFICPIGNKRRVLETLPNLSRAKPSKSQTPANHLAAENEIFNALLSSSGRVARRLQSTTENIPTHTFEVPRSPPAIQHCRSTPENLPEINLVEKERWNPTQEDLQKLHEFLQASGLDEEAFKDIRDEAEFHRRVNELLDVQDSDKTPSTFQVVADVHPIPPQFLSPEHIPQIVETERTSVQGTRLDTNQVQAAAVPPTFQVMVDVHPIPPQFLSPEHIPQVIEAERASVQKTGLNINQVQAATVGPIDEPNVTIGEVQPVVAGNYPLLSTSQPEQIPIRRIPENIMVDHAEPNVRVEGQNLEMIPAEPARPTIAEMLIQGLLMEQEDPEIINAIKQRGPIVELPPDIANNLEQRARVRPEDNEATERITIPPKKPPRRRIKYVYNSHRVIAGKLNKNLEPQNFVFHENRLVMEMKLLRHPFNRILPFDKYQHKEDKLGLFRHFDVPYDRIPSCSNILDNLFCGLFEHDDNDYDERNECEERVANLRTSLEDLLKPVLDESISLFQIEQLPPPENNVQPPNGIELPAIQVQAPIPDIPEIAAQVSANVPQKEDALQIPVAESRISMRTSQSAVQQQSRVSLQVEGPPQINVPVDNRMSILPVLGPNEDFAQIPIRISTNLPQIEDASLQIPTPEQPITPSRPSMPQPTIQAVVDGNGEMMGRKRDTAMEEVIHQKRLRRTVQESIVDVAQLVGTPAELERQQSALLPRTDPVARIVPPVDLEQRPMQRSPLVFEPSLLMGVIAEFERQHGELPSLVPQDSSRVEIIPPAVIAPVEEPVERNFFSIPNRRRNRHTMADVMDMVERLWSERDQKPFPFTMLCPEDETDKFTAASVLRILIDLHYMKMITLEQEPKDGKPNSVWISMERKKSEHESEEPKPDDPQSGLVVQIEAGEEGRIEDDDSEYYLEYTTVYSGSSDSESDSSEFQSAHSNPESDSSESQSGDSDSKSKSSKPKSGSSYSKSDGSKPQSSRSDSKSDGSKSKSGSSDFESNNSTPKSGDSDSKTENSKSTSSDSKSLSDHSYAIVQSDDDFHTFF